jgi:hypothetical protein
MHGYQPFSKSWSNINGPELRTESMSRKAKSRSAKGNLPVYKLMAIVCLLFLFFTVARSNAQRFNAFAGISYSGYGQKFSGFPVPLMGSPKHSLIGWNGSLEAKVLPVLGIVADFSGHYGNETIGSLIFCRGPLPPSVPPNCTENASVSLYTFTFGPQVSLPLGRFKPYAHALFGGALYRELMFLGGSSTSFADELGGGIDVSVIPLLAWRVQADALQTRFGSLQSSLRLSTGVVFRF